MTTAWSGHYGRVVVGGLQGRTFRATRWVVSVAASEEELTLVPSAARGSRDGVVPPPSQAILEGRWIASFVLGPARAEAQVECFYHPDDNPFGRDFSGFPAANYLRPGHIVGVTLYLRFPDNASHRWEGNLLISKVEQTSTVRAPVSYTFSGTFAGGKFYYPTPFPAT